MNSSKIKRILFTVCLMVFVNASGQDTIYLDANKKSIFIKKDAYFFRIYSNYSDKEKRHFTQLYNTDGVILYDKTYKTKHRKKLLKSTYWHETGEKHSYYRFKSRKSYLTTYWENGNIKKKTVHSKGQLKEGHSWNEKGDIVEYVHKIR
ncbi:MAG: hypothetical protein HRT66_13070 [Flavobacteriaceae bacterium]|nr:hypothetical protein [Flavobacteriaceae bacterium]